MQQKKFIIYLFYTVFIILLLYLLHISITNKKFINFLILDLLFLFGFILKYKPLKRNILFFLSITFYFLMIHHLTISSFKVLQLQKVKFDYHILFQLIFFIFLLLTNKRNIKFIPLLNLFSLMSLPISLLIDQYYYKNYIFVLFIVQLLEISILNNRIFINFINNKIYKGIYVFYFIIFILGIFQSFYIFQKSSILFLLWKFILYIFSIIPFLYYLEKIKNNDYWNKILYVLSVYFTTQIFIFTLLIFIYDKQIYAKANENFFAMYFDFAIFLAIFIIFKIKNILKKVMYFIFLGIILFLTMYVIILFDARTTEIIIFLSIFLTIIKYFFDHKIKLKYKNLNLFFLFFIFFYLGLYIALFNLGIEKKDTSLITRFFYWYVIYKFFYHYPYYLITGLGEYDWGYLYKYLTFDIKEFPFINYTDYTFYYHSHAHNDIISFLIGGGIIYLFIYFYIIYRIIKKTYNDIKGYILITIFIVIILHGITEPYAFSQYTGFIFWFIAAVLFYKNHTKINTTNINTINKEVHNIFLLTLILFVFYFLTLFILKQNFYFFYLNKIYPSLEMIYNNKLEIKEKIEIYNQKKLLNWAIILSPFEYENYNLLGDYFLYEYHANKKEDINLIKKAYRNFCISFFLNPNLSNYKRILHIRNNFNIQDKNCNNLKKFDPYDLLITK